jgi:hypothetical protein
LVFLFAASVTAITVGFGLRARGRQGLLGTS